MTCHTTLTFGCSTCIDRVRTDQRRAEYAEMSTEQLQYEWGSESNVWELRIIGGILVERSALTVDAYEEAIAEASAA